MSEMSLFDSHGKFVMPPDQVIATLDESKRERFDDLRVAAELAEKAEIDLQTSRRLVEECAEKSSRRECQIAQAPAEDDAG